MSIEKINTTLTILIVALAGFALLALGLNMGGILSPFVLVAAIVFLLYPLRENALARRVMWLSSGLFLLWFFSSLSGVLAPFAVALVLAYVFNPIVASLERRRLPRWSASLIVTVGVIGVGIATAMFVLPIAFRQFNGLIEAVSAIAHNVTEMVRSGMIFDALEKFGIPIDQAKEMLAQELAPKLQSILAGLFSGVFGFVTGFSSVVLHLINIIIIPFLFFYLLKDLPDVKHAFLELTPLKIREKVAVVLRTTDEILGQYLRGAIIVALIQGTLSATVLALIGVDYPLVLGIMTAVLNFIPYIGLITSLIVSCIVALFSGEPAGAKVVGVITLYLSQKLLEATILGPKIVGTKVGLHPIVLILSLLVFGYFLGFVGMLIAVPASALLIILYKEWRSKQEIAPSDALELNSP